jgi:hypothetical protein
MGDRVKGIKPGANRWQGRYGPDNQVPVTWPGGIFPPTGGSQTPLRQKAAVRPLSGAQW